MDLALTQEQIMLRTMATDFLQKELPKGQVLEIDESDSGFSPGVWRKMSTLGWPGMAIPEEFGGTGNSLTDLGVIFEAMGQAACTSPCLSSGLLSAHVVIEAGTPEQKQTHLPLIASGDQIFAFSDTEADYGWGPENINLLAAKAGTDYILQGKKMFIPYAHVADRLVVAARTSENDVPERGLSLFIIDPSAVSGITIRRQEGWFGDPQCEIVFDNVKIPTSARIGAEGEAWLPIQAARDRATAILCAYIAGGIRRVADMSIDYSKTRMAFGVPIGTFQRVQDRVIQAVDDADSTMLSAYEALWKLDEGHEDAAIGVSTAKTVASVAFPRACDMAHHVHAGIGTDLDFGLVNYTKRARTYQNYLGDANYHRKRLACLLDL